MHALIKWEAIKEARRIRRIIQQLQCGMGLERLIVVSLDRREFTNGGILVGQIYILASRRSIAKKNLAQNWIIGIHNCIHAEV